MLIQFSAENFLSFRDRVSLSLLASSDREHPENTIRYGGSPYLKSSVLYGANGSGKSNLLRAFAFLADYVQTSHARMPDAGTGRRCFAHDPSAAARPSSFEVLFTANGIRCAYGFSVSDFAVTEEYLYEYPRGRRSLIFSRTGIDHYVFHADPELQNRLRAFNAPNRLYLSTAAQWNYQKVLPAYRWLTQCRIAGDTAPERLPAQTAALLENDAVRAQLLSLLSGAGFQLPENALLPPFPSETLRFESDGLLRCLSLLLLFLENRREGSLLLADDLDAHLHPLLLRHLLRLYHETTLGSQPDTITENAASHSAVPGAQLICCLHQTAALDLSLLRRDQIWFAEKDPHSQSTELYSLCDLAVRKDSRIEKNYLSGGYGAVPKIR